MSRIDHARDMSKKTASKGNKAGFIKRLIQPAVIFFFVAVTASITIADSMRCEASLVYNGDTMDKVLETCGKPKSIELFEDTWSWYVRKQPSWYSLRLRAWSCSNCHGIDRCHFPRLTEEQRRDHMDIAEAQGGLYKRERMQYVATDPVQVWTYDLGPGSFTRILTFWRNELVKIELGPKP